MRVLSTQQVRCVRHPCFCKQSCRPRSGKSTDSPEPSISKSADFSMGTVVRYQSITLCRKCNKCRKFRFHAAGFTMISHRLSAYRLAFPVLPAECIHVPPAVPASENLLRFLKELPPAHLKKLRTFESPIRSSFSALPRQIWLSGWLSQCPSWNRRSGMSQKVFAI